MKEKGISTIFTTIILLVLVVVAVVTAFRGPSKPEKKFEYHFNEGNISEAIEIFNNEMAGTDLEKEYKDIFMEYVDIAYADWENKDRSVGNVVNRLKLAQTVNNTDIYNYAQEKLEKIYAVHGEDITYTEEDAKKEFLNGFKEYITGKDE